MVTEALGACDIKIYPIVRQLLRILGTWPASVAFAGIFFLSQTPENMVENENDSDQDDWIGITEHQQRH